MSNLAYIVYDEREQYIRGYLLDEQLGRESLYTVLQRETDSDQLIPWPVRRRWALQLVSAVQSLHAEGFVHGAITLHTVFLIPEPRRAAEHGTADTTSRTIFVSCPKLTYNTVPSEVYLSPELIARSSGMPWHRHSSVQSDIYALGVVLWALAVHICNPELCKQRDGRLRMSRRFNSEPNTSIWGFPVRDAIQDCLNAHPGNRPSTDFLLRVLREDALDDVIPELVAATSDPLLSRRDADERTEAIAALATDLQALSEDCGLATSSVADGLLDILKMEPEYNALTIEERNLAHWEFQSNRADYEVNICLLYTSPSPRD